MNLNFLLQSTRILNNNDYDEDELFMVLNFTTAIDNDTLNDYNNTCTILSYDSDLHLYVEILDTLLSIFEEREEYEQCEIIKNKKEEALIIMESKTI